MSLRFFRILMVMLLLSLAAAAEGPYMNIVVASGSTKAEAELYAKQIGRFLDRDPFYRKAKAKEGFSIVSRRSGKHYIATIEPLHDSDTVVTLLEKVQRRFPDAYVFTHRGDTPAVETPEAKTAVTEIRTVMVPVEVEKESKTLLYSLVALALIALLLVWRAARHRRRLKDVSDKLTREQEELEAVIERQEDIMVNVGQKIQAPAKEIIDSSEKILRTQLDPVQSQELQNIRQSDELLLDITNDLIDFLNIKSDKISLRNEVFNINNVLDEIAGMVSSRARGSKVEFIFDIEKEVPAKLIGDPLRLGQVLTNLLSNAMKFTDAGEVRLHIRRIPGYDDKVTLEFAISDTGIGIDPQRIDEIFEPFSSANDLKETGLGLYISRALTEKMHGTIELKSEVNKGSVFFVTLPFEVPDPNEKRHYRLPSRAYAERKVVIVEVQPTAADALKKMLEYFRNDVAVRSVIAIENKSDILFESDIVIVAENAFTPEVKNLIRRVKEETEAKVVLAGSMLDAPHAITSLEPLIDARIMKPLNLQRVFDLIVDLFEETVGERDTQNVTPRHTSPTAIKDRRYADVPETPNVTKQSFSRFAGASILIVEDNLINQKVLLSLLGGSGIDVTLAADGLEALQAVENPDNRFDLVLMDINMPVMDGYEATKHIRAVPEFKDLPIVSLTGLGLPEEVAKMYAIGMNAHLTKPIQIGRLYTVFERYLGDGGNARPEKETPGGGENASFVNSDVLAAADGLRRASGDEELYLEILDEFIKLYVGADDALELLLRTGDLERAKKLCLDIKGVGSSIGAKKLAEAAGALHEALSRGEGGSGLSALKEAFDGELHAVMKAVRKYLP